MKRIATTLLLATATFFGMGQFITDPAPFCAPAAGGNSPFLGIDGINLNNGGLSPDNDFFNNMYQYYNGDPSVWIHSSVINYGFLTLDVDDDADAVSAWIDFNVNGEFEDSEVVYSLADPGNFGNFFNFEVPAGTQGGSLRMRVVAYADAGYVADNGGALPVDQCGWGNPLGYAVSNVVDLNVLNGLPTDFVYIDDISFMGFNNNLSAIGQTVDIDHLVAPNNNTHTFITYTSSDESIATVTNSGVVTAVGFGNVQITCMANDGSGVTEVANISVTDGVLVDEILITAPGALTTFTTPNAMVQLNSGITPGNATNPALTWASSDPTVISVDENTGMITVLADGMTNITASANDGSGTVSNVLELTADLYYAVESIEVALVGGGNVIVQNETTQLDVTVLPTNADNQIVDFSSSDTDIATVSNDGYVSAYLPGTVTITVTSFENNAITGTIEITVEEATLVAVTDVLITVADGSAPQMTMIGEEKWLALEVLPADATNNNVTWESLNPSVATVSEFGLVTAVDFGETTIRATSVSDPNVMGELIMNVVNPDNIVENTIEQIKLFPNPASEFIFLNGLQAGQFYTGKIADAQGRTIKTIAFEGKNGQSSVDLSTLESGIYTIELRTGEQKVVKRIIVE